MRVRSQWLPAMTLEAITFEIDIFCLLPWPFPPTVSPKIRFPNNLLLMTKWFCTGPTVSVYSEMPFLLRRHVLLNSVQLLEDSSRNIPSFASASRQMNQSHARVLYGCTGYYGYSVDIWTVARMCVATYQALSHLPAHCPHRGCSRQPTSWCRRPSQVRG